jgi:membrane fusion protein (multidrug efflux system)
VLVELDSRVERAQLASAVARSELADIQVGRSRALVAKGSIAQAQVDTDESAVKTVSADIDGFKAQIDRKIVKAPFSGRVGIRQVNLGQYLNPGTTLTVLDSLGTEYIDFSLPQQRLADLKVGMKVRLSAEDPSLTLPEGMISAIDPNIDSATRTIKLRASAPDKNDKLRPGMFVNVAVVLPEAAPVVVVPATAIVHASYGDSVFVIEDKKDDKGAVVNGNDGKPAKVARQQFVREGGSRGDFVAIVDGVKTGEEVVSVGAFKLRNGAGIVVDNSVKLDPKLDPRPENR